MKHGAITDLSEKILSKNRELGESGLDLSISRSESLETVFEQDKLKLVKSSRSFGADVRVIHKGKSGVSATNSSESGKLDQMVSDAYDIAVYGKSVSFDLPKPEKGKSLNLFDPGVAGIGDLQMVDAGNEAIEMVKSVYPEMIVNYLGWDRFVQEGIFANSNGALSCSRASRVGFGLEISRVAEGDFFQLYKGKNSVKNDIEWKSMVGELLKMVAWGERIAKVKSGPCQVIFAPESGGALVDYLSTALNGKYVNENMSKLGSMLGKKIFDSRISLLDDPTIDWGLGSYELDDEGVLGYRKALIEKGEVKGFYYDLDQGQRAGVGSTGNGSRGPFVQADPEVSNLIFLAGDTAYSKLVSGTKKAILVYQLLGVGQNNPFNGDFQWGINLGFLIENGEVVGRVKDVALAGNVFDLLNKQLMWLSSDVERCDTLMMPFVALDNVVVTSK